MEAEEGASVLVAVNRENLGGKHARVSDLHLDLGAELAGQLLDGGVELIEEPSKVSFNWDLLSTPGGHDCRSHDMT